MPVREIVTRSGKKFRGRFPSRKNAVMVCWESLHERQAILLFEYSANVASYEGQPSEETYYVRGVPHRYYPDFRLTLTNGQAVDIEVKPAVKLLSAENKEKYGRIAAMYIKSGRQFRLLTEQAYRAQPLLSNLQRIHRASKIIWREADAALLRIELGSSLQWTLRYAGELLGNVERVLALVAWRELCMDLHAPIGAQSLVWLPGTKGEDHDPVCF